MISLKLENSLGAIQEKPFSPSNPINQLPMTINNDDPRVGAVGFISVLFPFLLPLGLVKVDEETREPVTTILTILITISFSFSFSSSPWSAEDRGRTLYPL